MKFTFAVVRSRRYMWGVVGVLVALVGPATSGAAQGANGAVFHVGDRIALTVDSPVFITDTLVVRDGLIVRIRNIGDISLKGVHRADVQPYLTEQIGKFEKNPVVHAMALINIAVAGDVVRPGFYAVPTDAIVSDMVMQAGGPTNEADLSKTVIQRQGKVLFDEKQTSSSLNAGKTLEDLQLMSGDQIVVGAKSHHFDTSLQVLGLVIGVAGVLLTLLLRR